MKFAHTIKATVFSHEPENKDEILSSFLALFPFDLEKNKIKVAGNAVTGLNETKIEIFEVVLPKTSLVNQFISFMVQTMNKDDKKIALSQAESRLDSELNFFLRFDKSSWINARKLLLTDSGKCFHIKIAIAAFPKKREIALNIVREMFSEEK